MFSPSEPEYMKRILSHLAVLGVSIAQVRSKDLCGLPQIAAKTDFHNGSDCCRAIIEGMTFPITLKNFPSNGLGRVCKRDFMGRWAIPLRIFAFKGEKDRHGNGDIFTKTKKGSQNGVCKI